MRITTLIAGLILSMAFAGTASATSFFNFDWGNTDWKSDFDRNWYGDSDSDSDGGHHGDSDSDGRYSGWSCDDKDKPGGGIVPEPSAALLFGLGTLFTTGAIRRKR